MRIKRIPAAVGLTRPTRPINGCTTEEKRPACRRICKRRLAVPVLLLAVSACSGDVADLPSSPGAAQTVASGTPGAGPMAANPDGAPAAVNPEPTMATEGGQGLSPVDEGSGIAAPGSPAPDNPTPASPPNDEQAPEVVPVDPGTKVLHRLNNAEYNNTVRDLLGTSQRPADDFVANDSGAGFDNVAAVLSLSPTHVEMYSNAAAKLVQEALSNEAQRSRLVSCDLAVDGSNCARQALGEFLTRAFRAPVSTQEIDRHVELVDQAIAQGETAELGFALALRAALISPHFLFRVELDPDPAASSAHALSDYELASRLSYFIWSSMPDHELFEQAAAATLSEPTVLAAQVSRMLQSPKAEALVANFAGQWLGIRNIEHATPDAQTFPDFDDQLRQAMRAESEGLFRDVLASGAPFFTLLGADFTYLNDRLAQHYGLPTPGSDELVRVSIADDSERRGLLTHAGILTWTSHPRHTSPVNRGKWVMDQLLCQVIPPPPPDLDLGDFAEEVDANASVRERLEAHRADPSCAVCHTLMDPIGFAFENYDAVGSYRTMENGAPIDSSGVLPDGQAFSGADELIDILSSDERFGSCLSKKLFTYALGRPPLSDPATFDPTTIDAIADLANAGSAFEALATTLVTSVPFTQRRGNGGEGAGL